MLRREAGVVEEVRVEGLVKRYRWFSLDVPSLRFRRGLNLVIGPNGSGKSTLLKIIAGFTYPQAGRVTYLLSDGSSLTPTEAYGLIGYVAEDVRLPNIRVSDILEYFSRDREAVRDVASALGLEPYLRKRYYELSNGFRKRVQLGIALATNADVLILDEPFSNVDVLMIKPLKQIVRRLSRERVVILTSHLDINLVPDTLTVLNQGKVVYSGDAAQVMSGRYVFRVSVDGDVLNVSAEELNNLLSSKGVKILSIETKDTSDILESLVRVPKS